MMKTVIFQGSELSGVQRRSSELSSRIAELEETLSRTQRELARAQENNAKLQRDLRENQAQKVDQVRGPLRLISPPTHSSQTYYLSLPIPRYGSFLEKFSGSPGIHLAWLKGKVI